MFLDIMLLTQVPHKKPKPDVDYLTNYKSIKCAIGDC